MNSEGSGNVISTKLMCILSDCFSENKKYKKRKIWLIWMYTKIAFSKKNRINNCHKCDICFQVGLAFLAGLAFAVILIPINRWLAIKIGKLSADMMHQKDNRVKVILHTFTSYC